MSTAIGLSSATLLGSPAKSDTPAPWDFANTIDAQVQLEKAWAFCRAWYGYWDNCDTNAWLAYFSNSDQAVLQDATVNHDYSYSRIAASFPAFFDKARATVGPGHVTKLVHVTGDVRYGLIAEHVFLQNVFFSTNGYTTHSILDLDDNLVVRSTDYWDSKELGESDIVGPTVTAGVVEPFGTVHPGGTPLFAPTPAPPPGAVQLAVGLTGRPSVSPQMLNFVQAFHNTLRNGNLREILSFFAEGATYVNPLIHQGPVLYGNFNQGTQIRGRNIIARFFAATLDALPDCRGSKLVHVVGGSPGGGFEWKAGGLSSNTGIDRTGLVGSTSIDVVNWKIVRMSVKFDTYQLNTQVDSAIRAALFRAGVLDQ